MTVATNKAVTAIFNASSNQYKNCGDPRGNQCISDLRQLRWKIQDRLADRLNFLIAVGG